MHDGEVLLVIDVQNDFCPDGRLAVPKGDEVVPVVNRLARDFRLGRAAAFGRDRQYKRERFCDELFTRRAADVYFQHSDGRSRHPGYLAFDAHRPK